MAHQREDLEDKSRSPVGSAPLAALFGRLARGSQAGKARGILRVWPLWERLARRLWHVTPIPNAPHGTFGLHFTRYRGEPFVLPDGTSIQPGDLVGDIHFDNMVFVRTVSGLKWNIIRVFIEDMEALAAWMQQPDFPSDLRAIYGITILGRGAVRVGFTMRDRRLTLRNRLDRVFLAGLLALYAPEGLERLSRGKTPSVYPQEAWMSRDEILRRYGSTGARSSTQRHRGTEDAEGS